MLGAPEEYAAPRTDVRKQILRGATTVDHYAVHGMIDTRTIHGSSQMAAYRQLQLSQVSKGIRWMPRRQEPKKDAVSCEKLG